MSDAPDTIAICQTAGELIDRLGGPAEAARILMARSRQQVWNWKDSGKIPPRLYMKHSVILGPLGIEALPAIWLGSGEAVL